jgi:tetratricopeptide (TPR) repeat protein
MPELSVPEKLVQALNMLDPVSELLSGPLPAAGNRGSAEAFLANAPTLFGHQLPFEKLLLALDIAVSAIQADPTLGAGFAYAAAALYRVGFEDADIYADDTLSNALPWARRGTDIEPLSPEAWETLTEVHCFRGDFAAAEKSLGEIYSRWGDGDVYARAAFLFFRLQGDAEQAMNWGALAWQQEWNTDRLIQTLFALGQLYRDNGRMRQAADTYRVLCEHDHMNMWGHHFWAKCEFALGNLREALDANSRAIELGGGHALRGFQEEIKHAVGRAKMGLKPITEQISKARVVAAPPAVVDAPAPALVNAPPVLKRIDGPAIGKVVPPPPARSTRVVKAPPAKPPTQKPTVVAPPPPKAPTPSVPVPRPMGPAGAGSKRKRSG